MDYTKRLVIAIVDGDNNSDLRLSRIHKYFELPINHLGYRVEYIRASEIDQYSTVPEEAAAILSWLDASSEMGNRLASWRLAVATPCGNRPKQIILGDTGVTAGNEDIAAALLDEVGLRRIGSEKPIGHLSRIENLDEQMIGFEADYLVGLGAYPNFTAARGAQSFLSVSPFGNGDAIDLVVVGEDGAYAHGDALLDYDPRIGSDLWILNPFAFLEQALATDVTPVADTTTRNGVRLFFATVSADGWLEDEASRYFGQFVDIGGEAVLRKFVEPYPEIPMTVSVAMGDFDSALAGPNAQRARSAAEAIFSSSNVSAATVGHDVIRDWRLVGAAPASGDDTPDAGGVIPGMSNAARIFGSVFPGRAQAAPRAAYRKYFSANFNLSSEITGSVKSFKALLPDTKPADAFLWNRNSFPPEEGLAAAREADVVAIGGGWEPGHSRVPTLAGMTPFSARVGEELQIYDTLVSDASLTGNWTADLVGLHGLRRVVEWTESPRRIAPFQLSISARAALFFPTVSAVRGLLDEARSGAFAPISLREYVGIVRGFESVRFRIAGELSWQVLDRGNLQTIRFDDANSLALDLGRSSGVLGAARTGSSLYVSLDPSVAEPTVSLVVDTSASGIRLTKSAIALAKSNMELSNFLRTQCGATLNAAGTTAGHIEVVTHPGAQLTFSVGDEKRELISDASGRVRIEFPDPGFHSVTFETTCGEGY